MCAHRRVGAGVLLVPVLALAFDASRAAAAPPKPIHCISPSGVDTNARYDVSEAIIAPFCATIGSGRRWRVLQAWFMNPTYEAKPSEFEPAGETPLDDFLAKFESVKYVVDPGTPQEKTYVVPKTDDLYANPYIDGFAVVNAVTLNSFHALSVGEHAVDVYWSMSAMHCDGFTEDVDLSCLPAGEVLFDHVSFVVTPGHF